VFPDHPVTYSFMCQDRDCYSLIAKKGSYIYLPVGCSASFCYLIFPFSILIAANIVMKLSH
jgi:hypothetical protein